MSDRSLSPSCSRLVRALVPSLVALGFVNAGADADASLLRYPDISKDSVVFVYANDLWIAPKTGGVARPLASPPGFEAFPRFSPDGSRIAFLGNYDEARDLYVLSTEGGVPVRVTHHPATEILSDWTPDGSLIFSTGELNGLGRSVQLFSVPSEGGLPTKLPVPYGANGSISRDGTWLAYTPHSIDNRTWKRYRGGMQTDVWLYNLKSGESKRITDWEGTDTLPMWHGDKVYYLSDAGPEHRLNIWSYDTTSGERSQITAFKDFDVKWPAIGPDRDGAGEIVFQYGPKLWRIDLATRNSTEIPIEIPGARPRLMPQIVDASKFMQGSSISSSGKRVALAARGDIWSAPAENGSPRNLTRSSGVAERDPAWSPDGKWIAFFADNTGEYELYLVPANGKGEPRKITSDGSMFREGIAWSPDSKKVVIGDKSGAIQLVDIESGAVTPIDKNPWAITMGPVSWSSDSKFITYARGLEDSRTPVVFIYDTTTGERTQVTAGMFADDHPTFDRKGDWLVYASSRSFNPKYSSLDTTWIYDDAEVLIGVPLRPDVKLEWLPTSDEEEGKDKKDKDSKKDERKKEDGDEKPANGDEKGDGNGNGEKKDDQAGDVAKAQGPAGTWRCNTTLPDGNAIEFTLTLSLDEGNKLSGSLTSVVFSGSVEGTWDPANKTMDLTLTMPEGGTSSLHLTVDGDSLSGTGTGPQGETVQVSGSRETASGSSDEGDGKEGGKDAPKEVVIELEGFEARGIQLPAGNGRFGGLGFNDKNHVVYSRSGQIYVLDLSAKKLEEKKITGGGGFDVSADGKKLLLGGSPPRIVDANAGANAGANPKPINANPMLVEIDPRAEWKQMFNEAWRLERDYFYDPNMHGVDWKAARDRYAPLLDDLNSREDLSYLIAELISELNVGHAYYSGGDVEDAPTRNVGMLGVDFALEAPDGGEKAFRITKVVGGAPWDSDARNPLAAQGLGVEVGDYLLAVNGVPLDVRRDPWASFQGLAGKTVTLTVSKQPTMDETAKDVVVTTIGSEGALRYRDWIETKRAYVNEKSQGKIGYIYVPNTGVDGQTDLVRQFQGQSDKPALIIDDRWNGGGQIPSRFIEMLNRPATNYWARRDTKDWVWPPDSHQGPKAMLINGLAGSGGDMFPWLFKHHKLGPLVGTRTWGGLVGISGNPGLIDGGRVTVPTFGFYELDGTWGVEGHGVDPDYEVLDDPALMRDGGDPQLDKAIELMLDAVQQHPYQPPHRPAYPDRSGMGIRPEDK